jgi:hypothetical protein
MPLHLHVSLAHSKLRSHCAPGLRFPILQLLISSGMSSSSSNAVEVYLGPGFIGMITRNFRSIGSDIDIFFPLPGFTFCLWCAFIGGLIANSLICQGCTGRRWHKPYFTSEHFSAMAGQLNIWSAQCSPYSVRAFPADPKEWDRFVSCGSVFSSQIQCSCDIFYCQCRGYVSRISTLPHVLEFLRYRQSGGPHCTFTTEMVCLPLSRSS